ncbi:MAG: ATP-binding cassette domain-containing protein [Hyphomonas sp.]|uniref:ABC transporter ATP-binding protein n=1 Tax=Hyphomonas sp. TaxID=87 RepID=UPI0017B4BE73|nr:ATP-binding cassette domain-containing protein [Hyphomonas sp.]MBU3920449.1 ATP-binding cassette domain-containing protein [Alphaproteobacteria bacterium]MBA3069972.1 ATP-binding cassette domain-containing protein [Hyphomonas sp.]MBU4060452.1 ATP-binding cassette domain-containing protein [Alphaproteobacteria bacterium]MBU4163120.1 ATP-binding cassette domain-containing protein [Alphaproteobacteria bacterium]MBU4569637.1 ATP-binding cassette domain-containing protein [Alphaproteobacteria ba
MISVSGLCISIAARRIVDGLSFTLDGGELVALTGPNGAGKSTVLKALAGVTAAASGEIGISGVPASDYGAMARARQVAWLAQSRPVAWNLCVEDVVALGRFAESPAAYGRLGTGGRRAVDTALAKADAVHLVGRSFQALSGGEQARVHLARLLASPAPCLLLDEPCAALDIAHQLSLMETLAAEAATGRAILVVLHDLDLAARFCNRIIVLKDGRKVADDAPERALSADVLAHVFGVRRTGSGGLVRAG